jgi:hypothetical protein
MVVMVDNNSKFNGRSLLWSIDDIKIMDRIYTIDDESYQYQAFGPGKEINGIKFTIPESFAIGTNLSRDSYISIEYISQVKICDTKLFLYSSADEKSQIITDKNITYQFASSTEAAAGNRYEESVYVIQDINQCLAVRYFIHYGVFENYPEGTITQFDKSKVLSAFNEIRRSLIINTI